MTSENTHSLSRRFRANLSWTLTPIWLRQTIKFGAVGLLNTLVDAGLYFALSRWVWVLPAQKVLTKSVSYTGGILNSFYWNRAWTFRSQASLTKMLLPFVVVNLIALGINTGVMYLGLAILHLPEIVSLAVATGAGFLWNFIISKFFVFK